mmetsp:Transcript_106580/g.339984  ORF Transcript_106580/g.339984 Transcript_106580/m.339984 type:complete len:206 (-) Transcript_106580:74-691(-)
MRSTGVGGSPGRRRNGRSCTRPSAGMPGARSSRGPSFGSHTRARTSGPLCEILTARGGPRMTRSAPGSLPSSASKTSRRGRCWRRPTPCRSMAWRASSGAARMLRLRTRGGLLLCVARTSLHCAGSRGQFFVASSSEYRVRPIRGQLRGTQYHNGRPMRDGIAAVAKSLGSWRYEFPAGGHPSVYRPAFPRMLSAEQDAAEGEAE